MLNYFRINDLSRLIAIAVLILLIRLPFYLFGDVVSTEDIRYMLLGEKIADGSWLYIDIISSESLLSGLFFGIIVGIFGKSITVFHIIAYLFTIIQVYLFNNLVNENRATISATYFPGLFYALFISFFPAAFSLSPFIIGQTFLLMAMNYQFNHLEFKVKRDEKIILIGILISLYSLFVGAAAFYILTAYLVFALYTNTLLRRYLLMAVGFLIPYLLAWGVFELAGYSRLFWRSLPDLYDYVWLIDSSFLWLSLIPALFLLIFLRQSIFGGRFTNYQVTLNFAVLFYAMFSVLVFWMSPIPIRQSFILLVPLLGLYASHYFIARRSFMKSLSFLLLSLGMIFTNIADWTRPEFLEPFVVQSKVYEGPTEKLKGKSVLILEDGFEFYGVDNHHASKFFDWSLCKDLFESELDYESIQKIYSGLQTDLPEMIWDPNNLLGKFLERMPDLQVKYRKEGELWVLLNS